MRAHTKGKSKMGRRFLLAAGLIIALVVPSAAFATSFLPRGDGTIAMGVERGNGGNNRRVESLDFYDFMVSCPKTGPIDLQTYLNEPITGNLIQSAIAIDAAVQHRSWRFNGLVPTAVGTVLRPLGVDAWINFRGRFRKHNKNKADGALEVTLEGVDFGSGSENCHGAPQVFHVHRVRH